MGIVNYWCFLFLTLYSWTSFFTPCLKMQRMLNCALQLLRILMPTQTSLFTTTPSCSKAKFGFPWVMNSYPHYWRNFIKLRQGAIHELLRHFTTCKIIFDGLICATMSVSMWHTMTSINKRSMRLIDQLAYCNLSLFQKQFGKISLQTSLLGYHLLKDTQQYQSLLIVIPRGHTWEHFNLTILCTRFPYSSSIWFVNITIFREALSSIGIQFSLAIYGSSFSC